MMENSFKDAYKRIMDAETPLPDGTVIVGPHDFRTLNMKPFHGKSCNSSCQWEKTMEETPRDEIYRRLRAAASEARMHKVSLEKAVIIGPYDIESPIEGLPYIQAPTLPGIILANTDWRIARAFEDA